jgi:hypothetical protein
VNFGGQSRLANYFLTSPEVSERARPLLTQLLAEADADDEAPDQPLE